MFFQCVQLKELDLSNLDFVGQNMTYMFSASEKLKTITVPKNFAKNATDVSFMFSNCTALENSN